MSAARLDLRLVPAALTPGRSPRRVSLWTVGRSSAALRSGRGDGRWAVADRDGAGEAGPDAARGCCRGDRRRGGRARVSRSRSTLRAPRCATTRSRNGSAPLATVTVTPEREPPAAGRRPGDVPRHAGRSSIGAEMSGSVVVFAPCGRFGELTAGQPVRFTARISRPTRHDLTVARAHRHRRADAGPGVAAAARGARRYAARFAEAARDVCPPIRPRCLPALVLGDTSTVTCHHHSGIPHRRPDPSDRGVRRQRHDRLRRGAAVGRTRRPAGGGRAGRGGAGGVRHRRAADASVLRAAVMGAIALLAILSPAGARPFRCCRPPCS